MLVELELIIEIFDIVYELDICVFRLKNMQLKQISAARKAEKAEKELLEAEAQKNNVAEFLGSEDEVIDGNTADLDFVSPQSSMDEVQGTSGGSALDSDKQK